MKCKDFFVGGGIMGLLQMAGCKASTVSAERPPDVAQVNEEITPQMGVLQSHKALEFPEKSIIWANFSQFSYDSTH